LFSNALAQKDQNQSQSLFDLAWKIMTVSAVLIAVPLAFYHTYIMNRLYTDAREDVLYILILNLIPLTINYLLSTLLTAANQARSMNRLFIVSILINALGHVLFTSRYGALGAAWTALITQGFTSLLLTGFIFQQKIIVIHRQHLKVFLYSLILTGTTGLALQQVDLPADIEFITFIFTTLVLSLITGLIPIRSIYHQMIRPHPM
jgi:O-antigen/teichoic acid export membrane protein